MTFVHNNKLASICFLKDYSALDNLYLSFANLKRLNWIMLI